MGSTFFLRSSYSFESDGVGGIKPSNKTLSKYQWESTSLEKFKQAADRIQKQVEQLSYNTEIGSYTRKFGGDTLDASLLVLSLFGYCDASSPRMAATTRNIYEHLSKNNMVYRYKNEDGLKGGEGTFIACTFWLVENFAKSGKLEKAVEIFDALLQYASPTGLLSEEIDPDSFELLGNYPQAFTHIGLINAALSINEAYPKGGHAV